MNLKYRIFLVREYEVVYHQGKAAVSGTSQEDALLVLEEHLMSPEARGKLEFERKDLGFRVRGEVIDTKINADKRGVIYSEFKRNFS